MLITGPIFTLDKECIPAWRTLVAFMISETDLDVLAHAAKTVTRNNYSCYGMTPNALAAATACGYAHVGWSPAGFLGDELPSESYPNRKLVDAAVAKLRDGDVLMMHLGIWSRRDPFAPMLDELLTRLAARGFCFAPVPAARR